MSSGGTGPTAAREPALDGVRAVAVLAVVAFHAEAEWATGGFLGVDVFFVLSGYLITRLLLREHHDTGGLDLGAFWARRMRRILPALLVLIAGVTTLGLAVDLPAGSVRSLPGDALAALLSVANWRFLAGDQGYFTAIAAPSLLEHTWSLSIEEQFYLMWAPMLAFVGLRLSSRVTAGDGRAPRRLLVLTVIAAAASAGWMWFRATRGAGPAAYWDTLARLQGPLIGAALAMTLASRPAPPPTSVPSVSRYGPTVLAGGGLAGLGVLVVRLDAATEWLYPGGFLLAALATAALVAGLHLDTEGPVARLLGTRPVAGLGVISYGVYLWHWPLLFVVTGARTGLDGVALHVVRLAATIAAAMASYLLVERPIRSGVAGVGRTAGRFAISGVVVVLATTVLLPTPVDDGADGLFAVPAVDAFAPGPVDTSLPTSESGTVRSLPASATTTSSPAPVPVVRSPPSTRPGPPTRVAFFGDSVAQSLARALGDRGREYNAEVIDSSLFGCGIPRTGPYRLRGVEYEESPDCLAWEVAWDRQLRLHRPDLAVFVLGRHEVFDRRYREAWTAIGDPVYDAYVASELDAAVALARRQGVPVVLLTAPYFVAGEAPGGGPRPENQPTRVRDFNRILASVGARNTDLARVVDLGGLVSPGGGYAGTIDGVRIRNDGVHFAAESGAWLAPRLFPALIEAVP